VEEDYRSTAFLVGSYWKQVTTARPAYAARAVEPAIERFGWRFQLRDKLIQTENDYGKDVFNGDDRIVERVDPVEQQLVVRRARGWWCWSGRGRHWSSPSATTGRRGGPR